jgi:hypothetical protein
MAGDMNENSNRQNLTGVWNGLYTYVSGRSVSFVATLIDGGGGGLFGSTHEPDVLGAGAGRMLLAQLSGSRHTSAVSFVKTYEDAGDGCYRPVDYEGALNGDATEIEGRWQIKDHVLSGQFLMIRAGGKVMAAENRKHARV